MYHLLQFLQLVLKCLLLLALGLLQRGLHLGDLVLDLLVLLMGLRQPVGGAVRELY